jgi:hypothetical protein
MQTLSVLFSIRGYFLFDARNTHKCRKEQIMQTLSVLFSIRGYFLFAGRNHHKCRKEQTMQTLSVPFSIRGYFLGLAYLSSSSSQLRTNLAVGDLIASKIAKDRLRYCLAFST